MIDGRTTLGFLDRPDLDRVLGATSFILDSSTGAIYRVAHDRLETFDAAETRKLDRALTCGTQLPDGRELVGTK